MMTDSLGTIKKELFLEVEGFAGHFNYTNWEYIEK